MQSSPGREQDEKEDKKMCKRTKKLRFKWELGDEMVSLHVNQYAYDGRLHIGMINYGEDGPEPFADMTINLPAYDLEDNEAFINGDISKDLLRFIRENKLGKVLPYTVKSGYGRYAAVAFDLEKLAEYDPSGVASFKENCGL